MRAKVLGGLIALLLALVLAACGDDETTTVTTTVAEAGGEATEEAATGSGEAASEEIAPPPDAKAEQDIQEITEGVEEAQQESGGETAVPGSGDVPALSFQQARSGLENARYCSRYVVAGPNTSCSFALNVAYEYFRLGRPSRFTAYSPVTGLYYRVRCKYVHPTLCRAGNGAVIAIA
jgi:hypothetical protein